MTDDKSVIPENVSISEAYKKLLEEVDEYMKKLIERVKNETDN